ncbi:AMP-dependent synthetase [Paramagnetospirillum kuznetsovii]|uniref:AMP-dependent synthetase n=2 Tax=Paramagnetospirillum kuznetsovii TaxID=2053833 RepID=A0A364P3V4_9PROT|nr:AMP-dependent synthetase [Paramagnetospirillum kuznetsovii]
MDGFGSAPALYWRGRTHGYDAFLDLIAQWEARLADLGIGPGSVCAFCGDYSPNVIALVFALMKARAVLVPLTPAIEPEIPRFLDISGAEHLLRFDENDSWNHGRLTPSARPALFSRLDESGTPGLVVFTSGSTGIPKGILHDCDRVMRKFVQPRAGWSTVLFLLMDHFGGFNTLLGTFAYGGVGVCPESRSPQAVCAAIAAARATLLPTTPTFLNLLSASRAYVGHDLSSLKLITYGTEMMAEATLQAVRVMFPQAELKQTYGLSESGVLRSKSDANDSLWVKIGGPGFETKVVDDILWVRSEANMLGYLNVESPFDAEGWYCTGDHVEVKGEYLRFLGRKSEIISVGGQKVFPSEVESVLLEAENVVEAAVYAIPHPLLGKAVAARITLNTPEDPDALFRRLRDHCKARLQKYKVPMRVQIVEADAQLSQRFKKTRPLDGESS